ncbi:retrovirus-related Pol polyprotein from transposon 17.6 [Trichonephila clavipes]|uniref:Retrovirus-related Pol polyprotein from transposon 17.6 n=1 Tax=Trichonephila clavipes TaxID=2585209 RepID=A0A8X6WHN9_TRICX|nr:retrovirus-related Pol polyprotein from transposon 17.6 [Trichonephila clavipes]
MTRLCIDFRKLNALCKADSEPLPIMDSLLDKLARGKLFSTLDFASGYWHVPIHPKDTEKLAFSTNFDLYEWCRLLFGIKVAPEIFNRLIRRILTKYKIDLACNYFDDIIVFSSSEKEHWNNLKTIFDICQKENIKLKLSKCVFAQTKINFLVYEIEEAHHPQTNGKNESVNQSLVTRLKCKVNTSSTKILWTELLDQVCNENNTTPHSITKYPPAYLLFGLLPYQSPIDQNNYYEPVDEAHELALQRTIDYHIKNKIRYDARCIEKKFNPGDLVVFEEFQYPNTRKLSSPFSGPYEIIKLCSKVTCEINKPNSMAKKDSQIVHISKLRCFYIYIYFPDNLKLSHE